MKKGAWFVLLFFVRVQGMGFMDGTENDLAEPFNTQNSVVPKIDTKLVFDSRFSSASNTPQTPEPGYNSALIAEMAQKQRLAKWGSRFNFIAIIATATAIVTTMMSDLDEATKMKIGVPACAAFIGSAGQYCLDCFSARCTKKKFSEVSFKSPRDLARQSTSSSLSSMPDKLSAIPENGPAILDEL